MTTIAYRDGVLAADSLIHMDGVTDGFCEKVLRVFDPPEGVQLLAGAGVRTAVEDWFRWMEEAGRVNGSYSDRITFPSDMIDKETDFIGGEIYSYQPSIVRLWVATETGRLSFCEFVADYYANGSGRELALGAMAHGANAEEAVIAACKHDLGSGGEIRVIRF